MIYRRGSNANVDAVHIQRGLNEVLAIIKRLPPIQLRSRHPQFPARIDPHSINPQQPRILHQRRHESARVDFNNALTVGIADIDIAVRIYRRPAGGRGVSDRFDVFIEVERFVERAILKLR